ncbi:MAG: hypothetical protein PHF57_12650 [Methanoregula sp.]|jgi:hypothetical protein|nr:hypothetical protein [Methanoregula sp.]
MIAELVRKIKSWLKAEIAQAAEALLPGKSPLPDRNVIIAAAEGNVMNTGKSYRKTSDHSPIFSLFTFFSLRQ